MGLLRERMAEDLKLRGLAPITVESYLRYAQRLAEYYAPRSPLRLGEREVKDFLLHMIEERRAARPRTSSAWRASSSSTGSRSASRRWSRGSRTRSGRSRSRTY